MPCCEVEVQCQAWGSRKVVPAAVVRVGPTECDGALAEGKEEDAGSRLVCPIGRAPSFPLTGSSEGPGCRGVGSPSPRQITLLGHYSPHLKPMLFNWLGVINESWCSSP